MEALEEALARHGKTEILNTDQGRQFTGEIFTGVLTRNRDAISMDGKGAWRDNVVVERLWRSVKYEEVYSAGILQMATTTGIDGAVPRHVGQQAGCLRSRS